MTSFAPDAGLVSRTGWLARVFCAFGILAAAGVSANESPHQGHRYLVTVDADLDSASVEAAFDHDVRYLYAGSRDAIENLESARSCGGETIERRGWRLVVAGESCITYRSRLSDRDGRGRLAIPDDVRWTTSDQWLWKPRRTRELSIGFSLPEGVEVSVPWQRMADGYRIPRIGSSGNAVTLFGNLSNKRIPIGDTAVRLTGAGVDMAEVEPWIRKAVTDVTSVYGRFPVPEPQVVVLPARRSGRSSHGVYFGHVIRDEGTAIQFYVDPSKTTEEMNTDWTAAHEFSHLLLPYTTRWVSEGFASYYQNVLLARRGEYSETEVWRRLTNSFGKAAAIRNPPRLADLGDRPFWEMRMLIYWSGAALALMADVELRNRGGGAASLDDLLDGLQDCCLPARTSWSGPMLFERFDEIDDSELMSSLFERFLASEGMPADVDVLLERLGVRRTGGRVWFDESAPLAGIRRAIMAKR